MVLIALLIGFRLVGAVWSEELPGFEPFSAVFFCMAACMGMRWLWVPVVAWLASYPLTNAMLGYGWSWSWYALITFGGFALTVGLGYLLRNHPRWLPMLGGAVGAGLLFYFVTNTGSWLMTPDYAKTWAGFVQAQTVGIPGPPPTWVFLKNAILANLLFTGLFLLGQRRWGGAPVGELSPVRARR